MAIILDLRKGGDGDPQPKPLTSTPFGSVMSLASIIQGGRNTFQTAVLNLVRYLTSIGAACSQIMPYLSLADAPCRYSLQQVGTWLQVGARALSIRRCFQSSSGLAVKG